MVRWRVGETRAAKFDLLNQSEQEWLGGVLISYADLTFHLLLALWEVLT